MKYCFDCKENLSIENFCKDRSRYDGLRNRCKNCDRLYRIKKCEKNPSVYKAMSARYYKKNRKKKIEYLRKWRLDNKIKITAHAIVRTAMKKGELERKPCEVCNSLNSDAHHEDYSKPLEVRWLCRTHHMRVHR